MDKRLAGEIGLRTRHLDERELERQPRIAALSLVLEHDREQVDQAQHRGLGQLVRLLPQPVPRLLRERQRLGHVTEVLDEQELPEVLEELLRQLAEILAALRELLDEHERPGDVPVDDRVAETEERVLLDGRPELEHVLHGDLLARRRGELVERRDRVAERPAGATRDERERGVGRVDALSRRRSRRRTATISWSRGRWKAKVWQRERTVGITFDCSVVQKTKTRWGGGSSISFSSAFQAAVVSWCASSTM